jgi:hypothetical protein
MSSCIGHKAAGLVFAATLCVTLTSGPVRAVTVTLDASGDTYLRSGASDSNEGTATFLRVNSSPIRTLVRFDQSQIASAAAGLSLVSATLELYVNSASSWGTTGRNVNAHRMTADWTELGATWHCPIDTNTGNSAPDCASQWDGGTFALTATSTVLQTNTANQYLSWDVTADIAAFLSGTPNYGWVIRKDVESQSGSVDYNSRQAASNRPRLVLNLAAPTSTATATSTNTPTVTATPTATATPTPESACPSAPLVGCKQPISAGKSVFQLKHAASGDKLLWNWKQGESTGVADFGDPTNTDTIYTLCVYGQVAGTSQLALQAIVPPGGTCGSRPCWKASRKGFVYSDAAAAADGIKKIILNSGAAGKAKIKVKGGGNALDTPPLPLHQDPQVVVQLKNTFAGGRCWEARFSQPAKKNDANQFKDTGDAPQPTPTATTVLTPTATSPASATATDTPIGPPSTPTSTPTPTATGGAGAPIGSNVCTLAAGSQLALQTAALPITLSPMGTFSIDCGAPDGNGEASCSCTLQHINDLTIAGVGDVCVTPAEGCPSGHVDCDGGSPQDVILNAHHNVGTCNSNAECLPICDARCASLGAGYERQSYGCEGYCQGGSQDEMVCSRDSQCPGGQCPGADPVTHGHSCNCICAATNVGDPGRAGGLTCNLGTTIDVELPPNGHCGDTVTIHLAPVCGGVTTETSIGQILRANNDPTKALPQTGPATIEGAVVSCDDLRAHSLTGLKLVGQLGFFDSTLGDIRSGNTFICQ